MKAAGIYQIEHNKLKKVYIGSSRDLKTRFVEHRANLRANKHVNKKLQNAWNKYGEDAFVFSILEVVEDSKNLLAREQFWMDKSDAAKRGYNILPTAGSCRGRVLTAEHKARISAANTGKKRDEAAKEKIRAARATQTANTEAMHRANTGRKRSDAACRAISEGRKGIKLSASHRAKIAEARTGTTMPAETRAKIGEGIRNYWKARREAQL